MEKTMRYGFTSLVILMTAVGMYLAGGWNSTTGLFPRAIGYPMIVLVLVILAMDIKKDRNHKGETEAVKKDDGFASLNLRVLRYFGWLTGFALLAWGVGITYTIPVYIFGYMKVEGKFGWLKSAIYAVIAAAFIHILFVQVFRVGWPKGVLLSLFF